MLAGQIAYVSLSLIYNLQGINYKQSTKFYDFSISFSNYVVSINVPGILVVHDNCLVALLEDIIQHLDLVVFTHGNPMSAHVSDSIV